MSKWGRDGLRRKSGRSCPERVRYLLPNRSRGVLQGVLLLTWTPALVSPQGVRATTLQQGYVWEMTNLGPMWLLKPVLPQVHSHVALLRMCKAWATANATEEQS